MKGGEGSTAPGGSRQASVRLDFVAFSPEELAGPADSSPVRCGAFLSARWLPEAKLRMEAQRAVASAADGADLDRLEASWRDRFGEPPVEARNLLLIERIRRRAGSLGITRVETRGERLMLTRGGDFLLLGHRFPRLTAKRPDSKLSEIFRFLEALKQ